MSCLLPLPYIRPCGTKCFAGGLLHFRGPGFEAEDLQEPHLRLGPRLAVVDILCSKLRKGKIYRPAKAGRPLTTDPFHWTQKGAKCSG